jgi:hypothetical protein
MGKTRNYYVVHEGDRWKVKLENGPVLSTHRKQSAAKREAERLARRNDRGLTVNAKAGYTRYSKGAKEV